MISASVALFAVLSIAQPQHHGVMYHSPQWSPDGRWILVSATLDGDAELYLLSPHGEPVRKLTDNAVTDDLGRWIDRGRRILFVSERRGRSEDFVMNADGSQPQPAGPNDDVVPVTPDGAFELREEQGVITRVDRRSGARTPLTTGNWAEQGAFSPDGRSIVYEQRSTADPHRVELSNIVVARVDGSGGKIISPGTDPSWSPDGQRLLFKVWDAAQQQLFVTTARRDGTEIRRLGTGVHPQWSPDGKRIAFMRDDPTGAHIWLMAADGTGQRCLTCASR